MSDIQKSKTERIIDGVFRSENSHQIFQLFGLLALVGLGYGVFACGGEFVVLLKDVSSSRGTITFLIVAAMVMISVIITIYAISSSQPAAEIKERFGFAKEVLTVLVGIVGTILGFYYGSSDSSGVQKLKIETFKSSDSTLVSHVSGGTPPYRFLISTDTGRGAFGAFSGVSQDGWMKSELLHSSKGESKINIQITDAKDLVAVKFDQISVKAISEGQKTDSTSGENAKPTQKGSR